jgi:hypothetical protein
MESSAEMVLDRGFKLKYAPSMGRAELATSRTGTFEGILDIGVIDLTVVLKEWRKS